MVYFLIFVNILPPIGKKEKQVALLPIPSTGGKRGKPLTIFTCLEPKYSNPSFRGPARLSREMGEFMPRRGADSGGGDDLGKLLKHKPK